jgi:hypothetical protein
VNCSLREGSSILCREYDIPHYFHIPQLQYVLNVYINRPALCSHSQCYFHEILKYNTQWNFASIICSFILETADVGLLNILLCGYITCFTELSSPFSLRWHHSPCWTNPSSKYLRLCSQSSALQIQFLTPMFYRSASTVSHHINLRFSTRPVPSG